MKLQYALATAAIAMGVVIGVATAASATTVVIPGTGYSGLAGDGNSGTDAFGQEWNWNTTSGGYAAWGNPGLGLGEVSSYGGSVPAEDFEISFVNFPGAVINQTPSTGPGSYNEMTRFDVCSTTCVEWTPEFVSANDVAFFAPAGTSLTDGESYFVNVIFDEKGTVINGATTGFTAVFTTSVPEPASWAMMLVGFGGLGLAMRRARSKVAAAA